MMEQACVRQQVSQGGPNAVGALPTEDGSGLVIFCCPVQETGSTFSRGAGEGYRWNRVTGFSASVSTPEGLPRWGAAGARVQHETKAEMAWTEGATHLLWLAVSGNIPHITLSGLAGLSGFYAKFLLVFIIFLCSWRNGSGD